MSEQLEALINKLKIEQDHLMEALEQKRITIAEWREGMEEALAAYHTAAFMAGQESDELDDDQIDTVATQVSHQYGYLDGFADVIKAGIAAGALAWVAWRARAHMYASAITEQYWRGRGGSWPLPYYPAQGTECLSNCGCEWDIQELDGDGNADAYWRRGKNDSCATCLQREAESNPFRIRKWEVA